jgi:predicted flap endonuclease-1-like 5' DNA nuclease
MKGDVAMSIKIADIEGIGPAMSTKLHAAKIQTVEDLLKHGATPKGRAQIAEAAGIDEKRILKWVNMADLYRIKGVGSEYAELLEASGVDTVKELRNRKPDNLHQKMVEVNGAKKLVRKVPTESQVREFVEQAKSLPPIVTY